MHYSKRIETCTNFVLVDFHPHLFFTYFVTPVEFSRSKSKIFYQPLINVSCICLHRLEGESEYSDRFQVDFPAEPPLYLGKEEKVKRKKIGDGKKKSGRGKNIVHALLFIRKPWHNVLSFVEIKARTLEKYVFANGVTIRVEVHSFY